MCKYCAASTIASNSDKDLSASEAAIYFVAFFVLVFISFHLLRGSKKSTELDKLEEWSKKREAINIQPNLEHVLVKKPYRMKSDWVIHYAQF